jgi:hypothetical protein
MIKSTFGLYAAVLIAAAPASAASLVDLSFGGTAQNAPLFSYTADGINFSATAHSWSYVSTPLKSVSQLSAGVLQVRRTEPGIGVAGGASNDQIDTNLPNRREGILLTGSEAFSIHGFLLSMVDGNDSLALYGVTNGSLEFLGYPGLITNVENGPNADLYLLAGQATGPFIDPANGGTQRLTLVSPTAAYGAFFFTTREPGSSSYLNRLGQGYRLDGLQLSAFDRGLGGEGGGGDGVIEGGVPEPASWAMLIAGFGLVGAMSRRRRITVAA